MILSGRIQYFVSYCHREALSGIASHIVIYASSTITLDSQTCSESLLNLDLKQYCSVLTVIWGESTHWLFSLSRMFNPCGPMSSQIGCLQNNYCSPPLCKYFIFAKDFISHLYAWVWDLITVWSYANDGLLFLAWGSVLTRCTCYMTCSTVFGCHDSLLFSLKYYSKRMQST